MQVAVLDYARETIFDIKVPDDAYRLQVLSEGDCPVHGGAAQNRMKSRQRTRKRNRRKSRRRIWRMKMCSVRGEKEDCSRDEI